MHMNNKADETISTPIVSLYVYKCIVKLNMSTNYSDSFHFKRKFNPNIYWIVFNVHKVILSYFKAQIFIFFLINSM